MWACIYTHARLKIFGEGFEPLLPLATPLVAHIHVPRAMVCGYEPHVIGGMGFMACATGISCYSCQHLSVMFVIHSQSLIPILEHTKLRGDHESTQTYI